LKPMEESMSDTKTKNKDRRGRPGATVEKGDMLLISSKLLANLKNKGILAFKQMTDEEQRLVWKWSKEVIRQYLSKLETDPANIRNVESLPFPKEDIKLAIKLSLPLYLSKNMHKMVKKLKTAYKEIGAFQGIDEADKKQWLSQSDSKDRTSLQNRITNYPLSDKYTEISVSEKKALLQEINDFVNDLEASR
jgi:hypothetical protein